MISRLSRLSFVVDQLQKLTITTNSLQSRLFSETVRSVRSRPNCDVAVVCRWVTKRVGCEAHQRFTPLFIGLQLMMILGVRIPGARNHLVIILNLAVVRASECFKHIFGIGRCNASYQLQTGCQGRSCGRRQLTRSSRGERLPYLVAASPPLVARIIVPAPSPCLWRPCSRALSHIATQQAQHNAQSIIGSAGVLTWPGARARRRMRDQIEQRAEQDTHAQALGCDHRNTV